VKIETRGRQNEREQRKPRRTEKEKTHIWYIWYRESSAGAGESIVRE